MAISKNLMQLTQKLQKQYGQEMVAVAEEARGREIVTHSTGSLMLDLALGANSRAGLPEGRIVEISGPESSGKCLPKDTYVLTDKGYKTIEKIFLENGTPTVNTTKEVPAKIPLINRYGEVEETAALTFNGKRRLKKITTQTGVEHKATYNHPLLVLDNNYPVWKRMDELSVGDFVIMRRGDEIYGDNQRLSKEEAYFLGLLVADAYFGENAIHFTNDQEVLIKLAQEGFSSLFDKKTAYYERSGREYIKTVALHSRELVNQFYDEFNLIAGVAKDKKVPDVIMESPKEIQLAFLSGYFECESYFDKSYIEVTSASRLLLKQIQLLLRNMNVLSTIKEKKVKGYENNWYGRLSINGKHAKYLLEMVTFQTDQRISQQKEILNSETVSTSHMFDFVPGIGQLMESYIRSISPEERFGKLTISDIDRGHETTREKIMRILNICLEEKLKGDSGLLSLILSLIDMNYFYDPILSIEELPEEPTFDVSMPQTHSFIGNGIINHNTTTVLLAIAARQREEDFNESEDSSYKKRYCVFVDAEHAFDSKLAEEYGVNLAELIYINPETAEQAMDVVDAYIRSGEVCMAVIDSVPSMVPASIEQASFEQQHMATLARFMSGVCQKISGPAFLNKCTVVFINQVREAIGKWSPTGQAPEVTPGGRALKYYSSIRITVRAGDRIKSGSDVIGHILKYRIIKNKIAVPFKEATVPLIYGQGIDKADELFQMSLKAGIIRQGGAWFSYVNDDGELMTVGGVEIKTQGRDKMIEMIRENVLLFGELEDILRGVSIEADEMEDEAILLAKSQE